MKQLTNISLLLKKIFCIILMVTVLASCSDKKDEITAGQICENQEAYGEASLCVDVTDQTCLGCVIINLIYDAVGSNVMKMHSDFSKGAMAVMMVGFSVWLALRLLKFVSSVTETNVGEVWNEILRKAFICLICGLLASNGTMLLYVINTLVFPVFLAFLELGISILNNAIASSSNTTELAANPTTIMVFGTEINVQGIKLACDISGPVAVSESGFPEGIKNALECMITALTGYLTIGGDIANTVMQNTDSFMPRLMGLLLYAFFWVVKIGFVFYLVDSIFQMGIIILLLPIFVLAYAFGPTRKWTGIGFRQIIASSGFMMCFSIIVALVLNAMISLVANNPEIFNPENLEASMSDISLGFLCLLMIGFLIYGSMGVSQQLTSALLGAKVDSNFQRNLKAFIQGVGKAIWSGIGMLISWGSSLVPQSSANLVGKVLKAAKKGNALRAKLQKWAGRK